MLPVNIVHISFVGKYIYLNIQKNARLQCIPKTVTIREGEGRSGSKCIQLEIKSKKNNNERVLQALPHFIAKASCIPIIKIFVPYERMPVSKDGLLLA